MKKDKKHTAIKVDNTVHLIPWKPGQSGNPSGRPKLVRELVEFARAECEASLILIQSVRDDLTQEMDLRIECAKELLNRGIGKPGAMEMEPPDTGKSPEERVAWLKLHPEAVAEMQRILSQVLTQPLSDTAPQLSGPNTHSSLDAEPSDEWPAPHSDTPRLRDV